MRIPHLLTLTIVGVYALTYPKNTDMLRSVMAIAWWDHTQMDSEQTVHQMPHKGHFCPIVRKYKAIHHEWVLRPTFRGWSTFQTDGRGIFRNEGREIWRWKLPKWRNWLCMKWSPILPTCMRRLRSTQQSWKSLVITTSKNFKSSSVNWDILAEGHPFSTISKPVHKLSTKCPIRGIFCI